MDFEDITSDPSTSDSLPVKEIYGSPANLETLGSPSDYDGVSVRFYFYPTWRSQMFPLIGFLVSSILCVYLSNNFEASVIKGKLFAVFGTTLYLHLPLISLIPAMVLGRLLISIYDSRYIVDERGVEAQIGLFSMSLRQPRLRYEDIRGVEPVQTIWERILGIGGVLIGSAMTQDVEIVMEGIADPRGVQLLIGGERDKRLRELKNSVITDQVAVSGD